MRTDLDHLPPQKQRELERVVQLVFEEFDDAFALAKHDWKKAGRILKVILYGSLPNACCVSTSSSWTNWDTCRSAHQAGPCGSTC